MKKEFYVAMVLWVGCAIGIICMIMWGAPK